MHGCSTGLYSRGALRRHGGGRGHRIEMVFAVSTFAIGDIHGNLPALSDLLERLATQTGTGDTVVFLGDYIDRGPDSRGCIDRILAFRSSTDARVECLLGNHEDWMLRTMRDHSCHSWVLGMEGLGTIRSYSPFAARELRSALQHAGSRLVLDRVEIPYDLFFDAMPATHRAFFEGLSPFCRTPDAVLVHGGLDPTIGVVEDHPAEVLLWGTDDFPCAYRGNDTVVYGHRDDAFVDPLGWPSPRTENNAIGIDTISHGILTAVKLPERRYYQSRRFPS